MLTRKHLFLLILGGIFSMIPGYGCDHTFYIVPAKSNASCCPSKHSCITLDNFVNNELPGLEGTNFTVNLIMLGGVHSLTVPMKFVNMNQVTVSGILSACVNTHGQAEIQLSGHNIKVSNIQQIEVRNLTIHGMGQYTLIVQNSLALLGKVIMNNVTMVAVALRIPTETCQLTIVTCLFIASMIETVVSQMSRILISDSIFLCKGQQYTIGVCNSITHHLLMSKFNDTSDDLGLVLYNVTVMDLKESAPSSKLLTPFLCDTNRLGPTDIYIAAGHFNLNITNCNFHRSYGSAIKAKTCIYSQFVISNTTFSDYTQGVLLFTGNLDGAVISMTNTNMSHNTINTMGGITTAATLTVYPIDNFNVTTRVEITRCLFNKNADNVGNLQIIMLRTLSIVCISDSNFTLNNGTVIGAYETKITFTGSNLFQGNLARQGGALVLKASLIYLATNTIITFANNYSLEFGGAIYTDDHLFYLQNDYSTHFICFYQPQIPEFDGIKLNFTNNIATSGGDHIYGTGIRNFCKAKKFRLTQQELNRWHKIITLSGGPDSYSPVSSIPMRVCLCDPSGSSKLQCNNSATIFSRIENEVYPGEVFDVSVAVVGAEFGATIGPVYANLLQQNDPTILNVSSFGNKHYYIQYVHNNYPCTTLRYMVWSTKTSEIMYLATKNLTLTIDFYGDTQEQIKNAIDDYKKSNVIPISLLTTPIFINITLRSCPKGFAMTKQHYCDCYPELRQYNITCLFKDGSGYVSREGNIWIGVDTDNQSSTSSFMFNSHCPYDICIKQLTLINLETDPDHQCAFNHTGILCGSCKTNYSIAIGSSRCLYCPNNNHLFLLIFFAAAGPLLYVFIAVFNLTITNGTINGLLFYANIVWIYQNILFPIPTSGPIQRVVDILKVFIAWLKLDFGIETCFIKGIDAFYKSMLQYTFPVYIWIIAGVIIVLYRYVNV